ncbi:MAG: response regulator [Planctomycetes bacterium]|nr:response regulator [Planctomycetota bacterium]
MPNHVEVLLVEDNADDAEMIVRAMAMNNVAGNIRRAKDGAEALEVLFDEMGKPRLHQLKLILLDIKLPKVDGIEVLRRIKSDAQAKMVPVVMLTSSNELADRRTAYTLGVNSYVVKPMGFDELVETMGLIGRYWLHLNRQSA